MDRDHRRRRALLHSDPRSPSHRRVTTHRRRRRCQGRARPSSDMPPRRWPRTRTAICSPRPRSWPSRGWPSFSESLKTPGKPRQKRTRLKRRSGRRGAVMPAAKPPEFRRRAVYLARSGLLTRLLSLRPVCEGRGAREAASGRRWLAVRRAP